MKDFRLPGDDALFRFINGLSSPALDQAFTVASTHVFGFGVAIALGLWMLSAYRARAVRPLGQLAIAAAAADLVGARLLKPFFERTRPSFALPHDTARVLAEAANSGSMPSNHAATAFAVAMTMALLTPQVGRVALPIAAFIGLSRVGVGVHWPSDVLAGALLGVASAVLVEVVVRKLLGPFDPRPEDPKGKAAFNRGKAGIEARRAEQEKARTGR